MESRRTAVVTEKKANGNWERTKFSLIPPDQKESRDIIITAEMQYDIGTDSGLPTEFQEQIFEETHVLLREVAESLSPSAWEAFSYACGGTFGWAFYTSDRDAFVKQALRKPFPFKITLSAENDPEWRYWKKLVPGYDI